MAQQVRPHYALWKKVLLQQLFYLNKRHPIWNLMNTSMKVYWIKKILSGQCACVQTCWVILTELESINNYISVINTNFFINVIFVIVLCIKIKSVFFVVLCIITFLWQKLRFITLNKTFNRFVWEIHFTLLLFVGQIVYIVNKCSFLELKPLIFNKPIEIFNAHHTTQHLVWFLALRHELFSHMFKFYFIHFFECFDDDC